MNLFKKSTFIQTGTPMLDKQEKYTINFSSNTTFKFNPKMTSTTPLNLSLLPKNDISSKKLLIDFLSRPNTNEK